MYYTILYCIVLYILYCTVLYASCWIVLYVLEYVILFKALPKTRYFHWKSNCEVGTRNCMHSLLHTLAGRQATHSGQSFCYFTALCGIANSDSTAKCGKVRQLREVAPQNVNLTLALLSIQLRCLVTLGDISCWYWYCTLHCTVMHCNAM